jgi:hypothetical protein
MHALRYIKLVMLFVGCVFGLWIGIRDLRVALTERTPTHFAAESFATSHDDETWVEVQGRVAVEYASSEASTHRSHVERQLVYVTAPVVAHDWAPSQPVHVLATFGPFTRDELAAWSREGGQLEQVRGELSPVPLPHADERFAGLQLGEPLVVVNAGTEPNLAAALLFSGLMLGFGGLAGYLLVQVLRDMRASASR